MHFILQNNNLVDLDTAILEEILQRRKMIDTYEKMTMADLCGAGKADVKEGLPVGTIPFVETWLKKCHGISRINPIEIPKCLRTEEFLKRFYRIVPFNEIPRGDYFVKDEIGRSVV